MAFSLKFLTCLVLTVCIVASVDAVILCGTVANTLAPCRNFFANGGVPSNPCCAGVKSFASMPQNRPDRQRACRCLQSVAQGVAGLKPSTVYRLISECGVNYPYPISMKTNCTNVE